MRKQTAQRAQRRSKEKSSGPDRQPRESKSPNERLALAARAGSSSGVKRSLIEGADPVMASPLPAFRNSMNRSLVWIAGQSGSLKCLKAVLMSLPEETARQRLAEGLEVAAWKAGSEATLRFLTEAPAAWIDPESLANRLRHAIIKGNIEASLAFAAALGPSSVIDENRGDTAFLAALRNGQFPVARALLPLSDVSRRDAQGNTPAMVTLQSCPSFFSRNVFSFTELGLTAKNIDAFNHAGESVLDLIHSFSSDSDWLKGELLSAMERLVFESADAPSSISRSAKARPL